MRFTSALHSKSPDTDDFIHSADKQKHATLTTLLLGHRDRFPIFTFTEGCTVLPSSGNRRKLKIPHDGMFAPRALDSSHVCVCNLFCSEDLSQRLHESGLPPWLLRKMKFLM